MTLLPSEYETPLSKSMQLTFLPCRRAHNLQASPLALTSHVIMLSSPFHFALSCILSTLLIQKYAVLMQPEHNNLTVKEHQLNTYEH